MNIVYKRRPYYTTEDYGDGVILPDGTKVPYSDVNLNVEPNDHQWFTAIWNCPACRKSFRESVREGANPKGHIYWSAGNEIGRLDEVERIVRSARKPWRTYQEDEPPRPGMYLGLFHGTEGSVREGMDDWGFEGPLIGPIVFAQTTYASDIKVRFTDADAARPFSPWKLMDGVTLELQIAPDGPGKEKGGGGCVEFDGCLYGDWTVFAHEIYDPSKAATEEAAP